MKNQSEKRLGDLLLAKYQADPEGFRSYLPEVAQLLDPVRPPQGSPRSPSGLTARERAHHINVLRGVLEKLSKDSIPPQEAVRGLEHCATVIQDDSLPEEVRYQVLVSLVKAAIGKSPGSFKSTQIVPVPGGGKREVMNHVPVVRGAVLDLDRDMRLTSITITPSKVRERRKLLGFVGSGRDTDPEVALRHDEYLAKVPHGAP